jgi:DNA-binding XRE family transcriptional regulator
MEIDGTHRRVSGFRAVRCPRHAIVRSLGYNPPPAGNGWGERLVRHRTTPGLSQKEAAKRFGIDPGTLARWERGEREPASALLNRGKRFLGDGELQARDERLVG